MRRLLRWTFNTLAMASLLLCLATAGLWVRSYWVADQFVAERGEMPQYWRETDLRPPDYRCLVQSSAGSLGGWIGWSERRREPTPPWDLTLTHPVEPFEWENWTGGAHRYQPVGAPYGFNVRSFSASHWSLVSAFAVLPAIAAFRQVRAVRRRRHRSRLGLCPACGYDLRASPGRCPECGRQGDKVKG